jgi:DNA-binding beta-propeller fold protein YncE
MSTLRNYSAVVLLVFLLVGCRTGSGTAPFEVRVEGDSAVTLPSEIRLETKVEFRTEPQNVSVVWSMRSGPGTVWFRPEDAMQTWASFNEAGTYVIESRVTGNRHRASAQIEVVAIEIQGESAAALEYVRTVATGFDGNGDRLPVASIDPSGLTFHLESDTFFMVDSEINEVPGAFDEVQATAFRIDDSLAEGLRGWDLTGIGSGSHPVNAEPTGIAYCPTDANFYVTNDDTNGIYRYRLESNTLLMVGFESIRDDTLDAEGITCDPVTGDLFVVSDTDSRIIVYRQKDGYELEREIDLTSWGTADYPRGPEGIAFDPTNRHLFIVSDSEQAIFELTHDGALVQRYDLAALGVPAVDPQGLSIGPSSRTPGQASLFIADGGVDNGEDPNERDGYIHELEIVRGD